MHAHDDRVMEPNATWIENIRVHNGRTAPIVETHDAQRTTRVGWPRIAGAKARHGTHCSREHRARSKRTHGLRAIDTPTRQRRSKAPSQWSGCLLLRARRSRPLDPATAFASDVLPVPGGPKSSTELGSRRGPMSTPGPRMVCSDVDWCRSSAHGQRGATQGRCGVRRTACRATLGLSDAVAMTTATQAHARGRCSAARNDRSVVGGR